MRWSALCTCRPKPSVVATTTAAIIPAWASVEMAKGARAVPAVPGRELNRAGAEPLATPAASGSPAASARPARTASRRATSGLRLSTGTVPMAPASMSASTSASVTPEARAISAAVKTSGRIGDWSTPRRRQKGCPPPGPGNSPQVAGTAAKTRFRGERSRRSARAVVAPGQRGDTSRGQPPVGMPCVNGAARSAGTRHST